MRAKTHLGTCACAWALALGGGAACQGKPVDAGPAAVSATGSSPGPPEPRAATPPAPGTPMSPAPPRVDLGTVLAATVQPDSVQVPSAADGFACGAADEVVLRPPQGQKFIVDPEYVVNVGCTPVAKDKVKAWSQDEIRFVAPNYGGGLVWLGSGAQGAWNDAWLTHCVARARRAREAAEALFGVEIPLGLPLERSAPGRFLKPPGKPPSGLAAFKLPQSSALAAGLVPRSGDVFGNGPVLARGDLRLSVHPNQVQRMIRHGVASADCIRCNAVCVGSPCDPSKEQGWDPIGVPHRDVTCCRNFLHVGHRPELVKFCAAKPATDGPEDPLFEISPSCGPKVTKQSSTPNRDVQLSWRSLNFGSSRAAPHVSVREGGASIIAERLPPSGTRIHHFGAGPSTYIAQASNRCGTVERTLELTEQPFLAFDPPELLLEPGESRKVKLVHNGTGSGRVRLHTYDPAPDFRGPLRVTVPPRVEVGPGQSQEIEVKLGLSATSLLEGERVANVGIEAVESWTGTEPAQWYLQVGLLRPLRGFADLHVHQFSLYAFAPVVHGPPTGPVEALGSCYAPHGPRGTGDNYGGGMYHCMPAFGCGCVAGTICDADEACQPWPSTSAAIYEPLHDTTGWPTFRTWPSWHSGTHQQVHETWLERAYRGGLRLMVMLASANQKFCANMGPLLPHLGFPQPLDCSAKKMEALMQMQLDEAHAFARAHDWYVIVKDAAEARRAIRAGKLAVVLGLESGSILQCGGDQKDKPTCADPIVLERRLDEWYARGVRYMFLVHREDSALGGPANIDKYVETKREDCRALGVEGSAQCSTRGLTPQGRHVLEAAWKRGMLVDIDHMSRRTKDEVIERARAFRYPLVAGHAQFAPLVRGKRRHEGATTDGDVAAIAELGGMVAPILRQSDYAGDVTALDGATETCGNSSQGFAIAYRFAIERLGSAAVGSDFNGFGGVPSPRFGDLSCWSGHVDAKRGRPLFNDRARKRISESYADTRVAYPFFSIFGGWTPRHSMGKRTFDVNTDSVAHIGLFPDFIAELEAQGVDVRPLLRSAEDFVTVWSRAEQAAANVNP